MLGFTEAEKRVFGPFLVAGEKCYADPEFVFRTLVHELGGDPNAWLRKRKSPLESERFEAAEKCYRATLTAFQMPAFDPKTGKGCVERDAEQILDVFVRWCQKKTPSTEQMPTSPPATASPDSSPPDPRPIPPPGTRLPQSIGSVSG